MSVVIHDKPLSTIPEFVISLTFGKPLRMGAGCQGTNQVIREWKLSAPSHSPQLRGGVRGRARGGVQTPVANDLINCTHVMRPPGKAKRMAVQIGEQVETGVPR